MEVRTRPARRVGTSIFHLLWAENEKWRSRHVPPGVSGPSFFILASHVGSGPLKNDSISSFFKLGGKIEECIIVFGARR